MRSVISTCQIFRILSRSITSLCLPRLRRISHALTASATDFLCMRTILERCMQGPADKDLVLKYADVSSSGPSCFRQGTQTRTIVGLETSVSSFGAISPGRSAMLTRSLCQRRLCPHSRSVNVQTIRLLCMQQIFLQYRSILPAFRPFPFHAGESSEREFNFRSVSNLLHLTEGKTFYSRSEEMLKKLLCRRAIL